jgi:malate dehydrogenase (oxaloacetate-decarboxylating)(NADP+)
VTNDRGDKLADHKVHFSRNDNGRQIKSLAEAVEYVKPTILMGLSTIGGAFDQHILTRMGEINESPIIFPLSSPSSLSECTFEEAIKYTNGRALFASGSPFPSLEYNGKLHVPGKGACGKPARAILMTTLYILTTLPLGNNMYVFPSIGLGAILSKAVNISQEMVSLSSSLYTTQATTKNQQSTT